MITPEEIRAIISEALSEGITIKGWSYFILAVIVLVASFLGAYFKRKGENIATKEDVKKITDEIESIKHEYAKELHVSQIRYKNEFEILSELSEKLVNLRDSAIGLRPALDYAPPKGKEEEWKQKRLERFNKAAIEMYHLYERKKPFFPENIYHSLNKLDKVARKEAIEYALWSPNPDDRRHFDSQYWEKAQKNAKEISEISDEVIEEIRKRTKKWETFGS